MYKTVENKKVWIDNIGEALPLVIVHEDIRTVLPKHVDSDQALQIAKIIYPMDEELTIEFNEFINEQSSFRGQY